VRRKPHHSGEGSYLASISDLMAGVLFLFIGIIVVFALNLRLKEDEATAAATDLRRQALGPAESRERLLRHLQGSLQTSGVSVVVDSEHGILRLPDDSVSFPQGKDSLTDKSKANLKKLAEILREALPCYSVSSTGSATCRPEDAASTLDAVLVEGHTDRRRIVYVAGFRDNWELSTARAIRTYHYLLEVAPELATFTNSRGERLLSVSGYADSRPVDTEDTPDADSKNRRIDVRFIMAPPAPELRAKAAVERAILEAR
jgi:chemotaxis protein MotB